MKNKLLLLFFLVLLSFQLNAFTINGEIGTYPITIEIETVDWETGAIVGKYKYASKNSYLELKGEVLHNIIWLEESYKGEVTGMFYLELTEDGFGGKWISGKKWFNVVLDGNPTIANKLSTKRIEDFKAQTTNTISGGYGVESYFLNDMWFREDNPTLEIGFNGGSLVLEELSEDSLRFYVQAVCGPTYHLAYAASIAHRVSDNSYTCMVDVYENDTCFIDIEIGDKWAHVVGRGNYVCGFGARAYLDHVFEKITDQYVFEEEEVYLDILKRADK